MRRTTVLALTLFISAAAHGEPFAQGNAQIGKKLFEEAKCNTCHVSLMGGDGNRIFTRSDRRVRSPQALLKQVRFCVTQTGARIFPEDIEHIAAFLNQQFYRFP